MKKNILIIITSLIILLFSACEGSSDQSPSILSSGWQINGETVTELDTLYVGDTLKTMLLLNPYQSRIVEFNVDFDREYARDSVFTDSAFQELCIPEQSDIATGTYIFNSQTLPNGYSISVPLYIIAQRARTNDQTPIEFEVSLRSTSQAEIEYNPYITRFSCKIVAREDS